MRRNYYDTLNPVPRACVRAPVRHTVEQKSSSLIAKERQENASKPTALNRDAKLLGIRKLVEMERGGKREGKREADG